MTDSVYLQLYKIVKRNKERYDKNSHEYLAIDLYCNCSLKRYKDWESGCTDVAMDIAREALHNFMAVIDVLACLNIINHEDYIEMKDIAFGEDERLLERLLAYRREVYAL